MDCKIVRFLCEECEGIFFIRDCDEVPTYCPNCKSTSIGQSKTTRERMRKAIDDLYIKASQLLTQRQQIEKISEDLYIMERVLDQRSFTETLTTTRELLDSQLIEIRNNYEKLMLQIKNKENAYGRNF